MPNVAIAGGASIGLGRSIVVAILETYPGAEWTPVVLSRSSKTPLWLRAIDPDGSRVPIRQVDYTNQDELVRNLQGIHTLISVALAKDGTQAQVQLSLLHAAVRAGCKRFAPAQWAGGYKSWESVWMLRMNSQGVWEECERHADRIECALFNNGMFMNYLGIGAFKEEEEEDHLEETQKLQRLQAGSGYSNGDDAVCQGVDKEGDMADGSGSHMLSISSGTAEIPIRNDGGYPRITFTCIRDVGRYVAAALNLQRWEKEMNIVGDTIRADELVKLAESASGKAIAVQKLTRSQIERELQQLTLPEDIMKQMWLELKLGTTTDEEEVAFLKPVVNQLCPEVKAMSVAEYLELCWSKHGHSTG